MRDDSPKQHGGESERWVFPPWTNRLREFGVLAVVGGLIYVTVVLVLLFSPQTSAVGYAPEQPVPYSHKVHAGDLALDCRYCHDTVERTARAALPPASTCMNCHVSVKADSELLAPIRHSFATGDPVRWVRVHDLPDFVYFDHSAHVNAGLGCVSCHGRVDRMEVVAQAEPLNMSWCLDCHRAPEEHLRPREEVTNLAWAAPAGVDRLELGRELRERYDVTPSTDCSACHR